MNKDDIFIENINRVTPTATQAICERHLPPFKGPIYNILNKTPHIMFFSRHDKENCLENACKGRNTTENITLIRWLMKHIKFSSIELYSVLEKACEYGNLRSVQLLKDNFSKDSSIKFLSKACKSGNIDLVKYLIVSLDLSEEKSSKSSDILWIIKDVCESGNIKIVKLIGNIFNVKLSNLLYIKLSLSRIYKQGHYKVLKWLIKQCTKNSDDIESCKNGIEIKYVFESVVYKNDFRMAKYIVKTIGLNLKNNMESIKCYLYKACNMGDRKNIKWILKKIISPSIYNSSQMLNDAFSHACKCGNLEFLNWLEEIFISYNHCVVIENTDALINTYRSGNLELLKFLIKRFNIPSSKLYQGCYDLIKSYTDNKKEIVDWLTDQLIVDKKNQHDPIAIIMKFFPDKRVNKYESIDQKCLEYVASKGNKEVMKTLMQYNSSLEPCQIISILNCAIKNGKIDIVRLLVNESRLDTKYYWEPIQKAYCHSQIEIVEFLISMCDLSILPKKHFIGMIKFTIRKKHFESIKLLKPLNLTLKDISGRVKYSRVNIELYDMFKYEHDIFQWLIEEKLINNNKEYKELIAFSLLHICKKNNFKLAKWVIQTLKIDLKSNQEAIMICLKQGFLKENVEFVRWLVETEGLIKGFVEAKPSMNFTTARVTMNNFNTIENKFRSELIKYFSEACGTCQLESLESLKQMLNLTSNEIRNNSNKALRVALRNGNLVVVQWLMKEFNLGPNELLLGKYELILAYIDGNMEFVEWVENKIK